MALDPQVQAVLTSVESMGLPPLETLPLEDLRALAENFSQFMLPTEDVASVLDTIVPGPDVDIPLRIYTPEGEGLRPGILYFHGGGFSIGSLDLVDPICRRLANRSGCVVISVGYRLGPEHPYPAAVTDAYFATMWIYAKGPAFGIDSAHLAVMGDSAGATVATVACMILRDKAEEARISLQVLVCPVLDLADFDTPTYNEYGKGYILTTGLMERFREHYLAGCEPDAAEEPYCSPLRQENLSGLPPAIIVTAEYDPLRAEAEAYAGRLKADNVEVSLLKEKGMIHSFWWMGGAIDRGGQLVDELAEDISKVLNPEEIGWGDRS